MKAVAYLRVSSEQQDIQRQYIYIEQFPKSKNLELIEIFTDKISASKTNTSERDGFMKMDGFLSSHQDIKNILFKKPHAQEDEMLDSLIKKEDELLIDINKEVLG